MEAVRAFDLIGPVEAELQALDGTAARITVWFCSQCKHVVNSLEGLGHYPLHVTSCIFMCKTCKCSKQVN